jgi:hypothetical protein
MKKFKKTKHSFYGKWLYKVSIELDGGTIIRYKTLDQLDAYFKSNENKPLNTLSLAYKASKNKEIIFDVARFIDSLPKDVYAFRCERSIFDLYTNDAGIFKTFIEKYENLLRFAFEPESDAISLLQSKKNIVVKKYPHDRYKYKVFLLPHKVKNEDQKNDFLNWCESQDGKITLSAAIKEWFLCTKWNWDRRYVLVQDEQTLLMMKLKNSDAVGTIYDYVVSDK